MRCRGTFVPGDSKIDVIYLSSLFCDSREFLHLALIGGVRLRKIGASNSFQRLRVSRVPKVSNCSNDLGFQFLGFLRYLFILDLHHWFFDRCNLLSLFCNSWEFQHLALNNWALGQGRKSSASCFQWLGFSMSRVSKVHVYPGPASLISSLKGIPSGVALQLQRFWDRVLLTGSLSFRRLFVMVIKFKHWVLIYVLFVCWSCNAVKCQGDGGSCMCVSWS
jgi:hypothetical protein